MALNSIGERDAQFFLRIGLVAKLQAGAADLDGGFRKPQFFSFLDDEGQATEQTQESALVRTFIAVVYLNFSRPPHAERMAVNSTR